MPLAHEDSQLDSHAPIKQYLAQHQAEVVPVEHEPDPAFLDAQARDWQARLEELKHWPV